MLVIFPAPGSRPFDGLKALVSFADLFEDPLRGLVARILVRVVLLGQTSIRGPDLFPSCPVFEAEDFVRIHVATSHFCLRRRSVALLSLADATFSNTTSPGSRWRSRAS